jgi:50S ribosomal subunit-associated GTPase HflX
MFPQTPHSSGLSSTATDSGIQSGESSLNEGIQPVAELREDSIIGIRSKCPHFRILVIGRANAGKTTLLKRVCNSVKEPEIYDENGKKVHSATLTAILPA